MSLPLVVLLCGLIAAAIAFGVSGSRRIKADPVDPSAAEAAVRHSLLQHPRIRRFVRERLDRQTAGGFMLTISFVIVFVVAMVIGTLLALIGENSYLSGADRSVSRWGSEHGTPTTIRVLTWVTQLGSTIGITLALSVTAVYAYSRRQRRLGLVAFLATVGIGQLILSNLLKQLVARERPAVLQLVGAHGYSFPSGHTVAATSAYAAIALVLGTGRSRKVRAALAAAATLIAISVATSRALLGVHWLSDVIAGLFIGWGWFLVVTVAFGGRAQRLGDPMSDHPQGTTAAAAVAGGPASPVSSPAHRP